jgi:hypothetical protein
MKRGAPQRIGTRKKGFASRKLRRSRQKMRPQTLPALRRSGS